MIEKPALEDNKIIRCLHEGFGIAGIRMEFLPLGADNNTAVYRASSGDGSGFFVKLRRSEFDETAVALPRTLHDLGIQQVIAPMLSRSDLLWVQVEDYRLVVYPFVAGRDGYQTRPSDDQWIELGAALRQVHGLQLPGNFSAKIRREDFSPRWRDAVLEFMGRIERETYPEPVAASLAVFLKAHREQTLDLVGRANRLGRSLASDPPPFALCHSDLHAGNLLLAEGGSLYIVDWDEPVFAPPERDLMCAGSGIMGGWRSPQEEEVLLYQGYGPVQVNQTALAYYRYERILMDIAAFCEQLLLSEEGGADRQQALRWLISNFEPGGTIDIARQADRHGEIS